MLGLRVGTNHRSMLIGTRLSCLVNPNKFWVCLPIGTDWVHHNVLSFTTCQQDATIFVFPCLIPSLFNDVNNNFYPWLLSLKHSLKKENIWATIFSYRFKSVVPLCFFGVQRWFHATQSRHDLSFLFHNVEPHCGWQLNSLYRLRQKWYIIPCLLPPLSNQDHLNFSIYMRWEVMYVC